MYAYIYIHIYIHVCICIYVCPYTSMIAGAACESISTRMHVYMACRRKTSNSASALDPRAKTMMTTPTHSIGDAAPPVAPSVKRVKTSANSWQESNHVHTAPKTRRLGDSQVGRPHTLSVCAFICVSMTRHPYGTCLSRVSVFVYVIRHSMYVCVMRLNLYVPERCTHMKVTHY
jgi:hypothetical protein